MSESRPQKCTHCQDSPTIHVTKVVDGKAVKIGLCSSCPKALVLKQGKAWDLIGEEDGGLQPPKVHSDESGCPSCGLKPSDFKETGRLGCARCYEAFGDKLEPVINKLHKGVSHLGKVPKGKTRKVSPEEIVALQRRLEEYVSREDYEMAALVRDKIKSLGI